MKKLCSVLVFWSIFSLVFLFFPNTPRDQIWMFISKNFHDWYKHHNSSNSFLGSHYLKQMVEESRTPARCFPRGKQLPLVTAGQMSISDSQNTYSIKKKIILFGGNTASQAFLQNKNAETSVQKSKITFRIL